eukprot:6455385-Amphidinium_carterae.1
MADWEDAPCRGVLMRSFETVSQLAAYVDSAEDVRKLLREEGVSDADEKAPFVWDWLAPQRHKHRRLVKGVRERYQAQIHCPVASTAALAPRITVGCNYDKGVKRTKWRTAASRALGTCHSPDERQRVEDAERDKWAQVLWTYAEELKLPLPQDVEQGRLQKATAMRMLARGLRYRTLRNRARRWQKFRNWLFVVKQRYVPEDEYDFCEYIIDLERAECGPTVPRDAWCALNLIEEVGGRPKAQR